MMEILKNVLAVIGGVAVVGGIVLGCLYLWGIEAMSQGGK